jgi:hypothetical protein
MSNPLEDILDKICGKSSEETQANGTPYEKCCDTLETLKRQLADKEAE